MQLTQVSTTKEQIAQLMSYPKNTPVTMVNIIKFKSKTKHTDESGADVYARYANNVLPILAQTGAKLIWKGSVSNTVIGDPEDQPDLILLVEYPSVDHFLGMVMNPEYQKVAEDRTSALEYGGLIACMTES